MNKSKLSALLSLAFVFFSGAVLGAFAYRLYSANPVQSTPILSNQKKSPEEFRKNYVSDLTKQVKLNPEQVKQLNAVLDETRDEFDKINEKHKAERDAINEKRAAFE